LIARGATFAIGTTGGSKDAVVVEHTHTGTAAEAGSHAHGLPSSGESGTVGTSNIAGASFRFGSANPVTDASGAHTHTLTISSTGSSGTNANMQPYAALLACIYY
jgi:microcystin-dependent protein